jgi:hypothetical protein
MVAPRESHWVAAKHVPRYLKGIVHYGIKYIEMMDFYYYMDFVIQTGLVALILGRALPIFVSAWVKVDILV